MVSGVITLVGTALSLLCTVALAHGLSRPGTVAGKPLLVIDGERGMFHPSSWKLAWELLSHEALRLVQPLSDRVVVATAGTVT